MKSEKIGLAHGSGGAESAELFDRVFFKHFNNDVIARLEDSAVVSFNGDGEKDEHSLAISTDSFVVRPLVFPGGDIGKLAICGTVNDILMSGAEPGWITCGFVIEAGLSINLLDDICLSMAKAATEAGVAIVAGDTKVIEGHSEDGGLVINTTGIGVLKASRLVQAPQPSGIKPGDAIVVTGNLGDHHAAIMSARMGIKNNIVSDCALLHPIIHALREADIPIHAMRDVTRGGLGTVLNELATASGISIVLEEESIPVRPEVKAFCGMMGLDPIFMGNEGKMVLVMTPENANRALAMIRETEIGRDAAIIGKASSKKKDVSYIPVTMKTRVGGSVRVDVLYGEGLPRIC